MRRLPVFVYFFICAILPSIGQNIPSNSKHDTLSIKHNAQVDNLPIGALAHKTLGVEFNPLRLLMGLTTNEIGNYYTHLSGGVSLFAIDRRAEISFPFLYMFGEYDNIPWKVLNIDGTYRRFFHHQNGYYYSAGMRYTYVEGEEVAANVNSPPTGKQIFQRKAGIYIGIGYRYFSTKGWYWGTGIICGRYFSNDESDIVDVKLATKKFILDFDVLKFGCAF